MESGRTDYDSEGIVEGDYGDNMILCPCYYGRYFNIYIYQWNKTPCIHCSVENS